MEGKEVKSMGKIRGNGLHIAMGAKKLNKELELTEVETLGESVIEELKGLGSTIDAVVQSWYRIREEEVDRFLKVLEIETKRLCGVQITAEEKEIVRRFDEEDEVAYEMIMIYVETVLYWLVEDCQKAIKRKNEEVKKE